MEVIMAKTTGRAQKRKNVIDVLNKARALELRAIMQYMNHHYNLDNMDYGEMAANMKLIAVDEMKHAELFAERIEELEGEPTTQPASKPESNQDVKKIFTVNAILEDGAIEIYNKSMEICRASGDNATAKLFEQIIDDEQLHFNYFDNVRRHIESLGETYLAQIAGTPSSAGIVYQGFAARQGSGSAGA
jgi:bacterioferritin